MENGKLKVPKKIDTRLIDKGFFQEAREEGVVCYEPWAGLCAGLERLLRCGVKVKKYLCQDISTASQAVARTRCLARSRRHPDLFSAAAIHLEQLPSNLEDIRLKDLVHAGALSGDRPADRYVSDILQQGWKPREVVSGDRKPHHIANVVGEPMRVLPTILATQNSRAFRAPRAGTVVRIDDITEEGESREVNLDEKAIVMGYSASELRMTGGMSDEELAGIFGLAMDRRAMELLFAVAEASTTRLPRSEESQEEKQGVLAAIPIAGLSETPGAPEATPEPAQAQLAEWVTRSSDYTRQWKLAPMEVENYKTRHRKTFSKAGDKPVEANSAPEWTPVEREKEMRLPRLADTVRLTAMMANVTQQEAFREKHPDIHEDALCLEWLKTGGSASIPEEDYHIPEGETPLRTRGGHAYATGDQIFYVSLVSGLGLAYEARDEGWRIQRILIMTEHYTRFIVCVPIPNKEASTIASAFCNHVLSVFGAPAECLVGGEAQSLRETLPLYEGRQCRIDRRVTSPDSPEGNGLTERV
ncbi:hypothetical protein CYMTET_42165, partial [Cymbomonas tetramitiformis]